MKFVSSGDDFQPSLGTCTDNLENRQSLKTRKLDIQRQVHQEACLVTGSSGRAVLLYRKCSGAVPSLPLRGCDFFVFLQMTVLKIKHLYAKKLVNLNKVTASQDDIDSLSAYVSLTP
jgi:hypothetical protein